MLLILAFSLTFCKSNKTKDTSQDIDCSKFNDKYVEYRIVKNKDSALYYIDKAIACDVKDNFFKMEKVKLLVSYRDYLGASKLAYDLSKGNDPTFKMLYGVLLLKQNDTEADKVLEKSYTILSDNTKSYDDSNSNLHYYKIGLDNYFNGKNYSLQRVDEYKKNYNTPNNIQMAILMENLIKNSSKEELLFNLFNIKK